MDKSIGICPMTTLQAKPRSSAFDASMLEIAKRYCLFKTWTDWYVEAEAAGRGIVLWLHWAVDGTEMQALYDACLSCIDFKAAHSPDDPWESMEFLDEDATFSPNRIYLCRYILATDP